MVNIYVAYTAPINPPGATPILTPPQLWKGLQRKVRHAEEFVPVITKCEVLEEKGREVVRQVLFKEGSGPKGFVKEWVTEFEPTKVDFRQENGSTISNVVSDGPDGTEGDLHMTYVFEWLHEDIEAGSTEEKEMRTKEKVIAKMAVDKTIESIRKMVVEKTI